MSRYTRLAIRCACAGLLVAAAAWLLTAGVPRSSGTLLAAYGNSGPPVHDVPAVTPAPARRVFRISGRVRGLYPGRKLPLVLTITNPQKYAITVTAITTKVGNASAACSATYLVVTRFNGSLHVAAGHHAAISVLATMSRAAPNACQGRLFPLAYFGQGRVP